MSRAVSLSQIGEGLVVLAFVPPVTAPTIASRAGSRGADIAWALNRVRDDVTFTQGARIVLVSSQPQRELWQECEKSKVELQGMGIPDCRFPGGHVPENAVPVVATIRGRYFRPRIVVLQNGSMVALREVPDPTEAHLVMRNALNTAFHGND